ncbi:TetR/AcrR family transcriptional regulator [Acinetobacter pittii]|uniref:TetR/AcrR family transcriptional regulator n=1 Tax=Acinetobacter pittii TaxID=48296 RepID=UPI003892CB17
MTSNIRDGRIRAPQQRQIERTNQIIDCMESLVKQKEINDISLSEISELTGIALPSIYYHFPNKNSILIALTERIHEQWRSNIRSKLSSEPVSWQTLIFQIIRAGADFLNHNSFVPKLILSSTSPIETRSVDASQNANLAIAIMDRMDQTYEGINKQLYTDKMIIAMYILDGIWQNAFFQYNHIPESIIKEAQKAIIAYLRCYFPDTFPYKVKIEA